MRNATIGLCLLFAACNSSPDETANVGAALQRIQPCIEGQAETFLGSLSDLGDILRLVLNQDSFLQQTGPGITPTGDPTVWNFVVGPLSGTATFSHDPTQPFVLGDTLMLDWAYASGTVVGDGMFDLELTSATTIELLGSGTFADGVCTMDLTIADPNPLVFDTSSLGSLAVNFSGLGVTGRADLTVTSAPDVFTGTLTIPAVGAIALNPGFVNGAPISPISVAVPGTGGGGGGGGGVTVQDWLDPQPGADGVFRSEWVVEWRCVVSRDNWPLDIEPYDPNFRVTDCNIDYEVERDANGAPVLDPDGFPVLRRDANGDLIPRLDADGNTIWVADRRCVFGTSRIFLEQDATDPNTLNGQEFGIGIPNLTFSVTPNGDTITYTVSWTDALGVQNSETQTWTLGANGDTFTKTSDLTINGNETLSCEGRARRVQ